MKILCDRCKREYEVKVEPWPGVEAICPRCENELITLRQRSEINDLRATNKDYLAHIEYLKHRSYPCRIMPGRCHIGEQCCCPFTKEFYAKKPDDIEIASTLKKMQNGIEELAKKLDIQIK